MESERRQERTTSLWTFVGTFVLLTAVVATVLGLAMYNTNMIGQSRATPSWMELVEEPVTSLATSSTSPPTEKWFSWTGDGTEAPIAEHAGTYCAHRCKEKRIRKDYMHLTPAERDLYKEAVQALYKSKIYLKYVMIHENGVNDPFAHGSSGFLPWHRKFLLEYENTLRCLAPKFQCVTIPYWDWAEWQAYCDEAPGGCASYDDVPPNMREHLPASHASILADFGGEGTEPKDGQKTFGTTGHPDGVGCVNSGPFAGWVDHEGLCLSRGKNWSMPHPKNGPLSDSVDLLKHLIKDVDYGKTKGYRASLQGMPHNPTHNYLGGHMRSMRSPFDPIFWSHHAFLDKNWALWQDCHDYEHLDKASLNETQYDPMHRSHLEDDGIDMPMPFLITTEQFKHGPQCSASSAKNDKCRVCMGTITSGGRRECTDKRPCWCHQRWHPSCVNVCANEKCLADCGTGGEIRDLKVVADFKREDGKEWVGGDEQGYYWDHDKLGDTPRDWAVSPQKLKTPYNYQVSELDAKVAGSACDLSWEGEMKELMAAAANDHGNGVFSQGDSPADAFMKSFKKAANQLKWKGVDPTTVEGRRLITAKALEIEGKANCQKRNAGPACRMPDGSKSEECGFSCKGPIDKQPEVCGFHSTWMFMDEEGASAIQDYCQDVSAYKAAIVRGGFAMRGGVAGR